MEPCISLNRITGLDPAGPAFELARKEVRIDKSDANFVDIIHTNGGNENDGFLGMNNAVGHADFFPNGGHTQVRFQSAQSETILHENGRDMKLGGLEIKQSISIDRPFWT